MTFLVITIKYMIYINFFIIYSGKEIFGIFDKKGFFNPDRWTLNVIQYKG